MTPLDDLFSTDESRAESQFEKVVTLNPAEISDFPNHPFKVKQDDAMAEMVESVRKYGVLVPALVRPKENGGYEMVAGHRRKFAAALAELTEIPCIVRNLSDDEATIIMVDSNLQRETILPSEKAFAYKMKLEAMKRQGQRTDLTSSPLDNKLSGTTSAQQLSQKSGDSQPQIYRFIRLTELIPPVLQMVDDGKIAFRPAVELSYLSKDQQQSLHDTMECEDCTPSLAQAIKMKEFSKDGRLTDEVILSIMQEEKPNQKEQFKMPKERISKYFAPGTPAQKIEDTIVKALEMYRKRERQRDISTIMTAAGFGTAGRTVLPSEIVTAVEDCGFFESIPLWAVTLIGGLFITVLSFIMIMTVYGRFFKLYLYTAIAPVPLSAFAGEPSQNVGKSFIKSYAAVCLEGAIIVLACIVFSLFASAPPVVDPNAAAVSMVWSYIGELVFNMLVLVGAVKMADRVVREMMGL